MTTQTRRPTGDGDASGAWTYSSGSTAWNLVNDDPAVDTSYAVSPNAAGGTYRYFTFGAFTVSAGSTITSVALYYRVKDTGGTNNLRGAVKVGGVLYGTTDPGVNPTNVWADYSYSFSVNPRSGVAWTVDDINGVGTNALQQFGISSSDAAPELYLSQIYLVVTYTEGAVVREGTADLTAVSSITAEGAKTSLSSADLASVSGSVSVGYKITSSSADCGSVAGSVTYGYKKAAASCGMVATASITETGQKIAQSSVELTSVVVVVADGSVKTGVVSGSAVLSAMASCVSDGVKVGQGRSVLSVLGSLTVIGTKKAYSDAVLSAIASIIAASSDDSVIDSFFADSPVTRGLSFDSAVIRSLSMESAVTRSITINSFLR